MVRKHDKTATRTRVFLRGSAAKDSASPLNWRRNHSEIVPLAGATKKQYDRMVKGRLSANSTNLALLIDIQKRHRSQPGNKRVRPANFLAMLHAVFDSILIST